MLGSDFELFLQTISRERDLSLFLRPSIDLFFKEAWLRHRDTFWTNLLLLAALHSGTHFTVMPSTYAKLCRHPVQRYAATIGRQDIIRAGGVFGDKRRFFSVSQNLVYRQVRRNR